MTDVAKYPILMTKGLRLKDISIIEGHLIITLQAPAGSGFNEPIVVDIITDVTRITFRYAILDQETSTVRKYLGRAGDPTKDDYVIEGV
jgi:hypothetical protein